LLLKNGSRSFHWPLAAKAKIRNVMHVLFEHAKRYDWTDRNPISMVRQSARRLRVPDVLEPTEIKALLAELEERYKTMVFLDVVTGLRVSELLALQWRVRD
jgi:integrase